MVNLRMVQFYKTKTCPWYFKGQCERADACRFAHNNMEKRKLPDLSRTTLCSFFVQNGTCNVSDCRFAHQVEELRATSEIYKTSLCFMYMKSRCDAGIHCRHAHGTHELRQQEFPTSRRATISSIDYSPEPRQGSVQSKLALAHISSDTRFETAHKQFVRTTGTCATEILKKPIQSLRHTSIKSNDIFNTFMGATRDTIHYEQQEYHETRYDTVPACIVDNQMVNDFSESPSVNTSRDLLTQSVNILRDTSPCNTYKDPFLAAYEAPSEKKNNFLMGHSPECAYTSDNRTDSHQNTKLFCVGYPLNYETNHAMATMGWRSPDTMSTISSPKQYWGPTLLPPLRTEPPIMDRCCNHRVACRTQQSDRPLVMPQGDISTICGDHHTNETPPVWYIEKLWSQIDIDPTLEPFHDSTDDGISDHWGPLTESGSTPRTHRRMNPTGNKGNGVDAIHNGTCTHERPMLPTAPNTFRSAHMYLSHYPDLHESPSANNESYTNPSSIGAHEDSWIIDHILAPTDTDNLT